MISDRSQMFHDMAVQQGYVPESCTLDGEMVMLLIKREDPCAGCNMDRDVCKGRPKSSRV